MSKHSKQIAEHLGLTIRDRLVLEEAEARLEKGGLVEVELEQAKARAEDYPGHASATLLMLNLMVQDRLHSVTPAPPADEAVKATQARSEAWRQRDGERNALLVRLRDEGKLKVAERKALAAQVEALNAQDIEAGFDAPTHLAIVEQAKALEEN